MADLERELKLDHQQLQQEPSPSAVMPGSGTSFTFSSRASSIGSVNAISCSSASSTHNTGNVHTCLWHDSFEVNLGCVASTEVLYGHMCLAMHHWCNGYWTRLLHFCCDIDVWIQVWVRVFFYSGVKGLGIVRNVCHNSSTGTFWFSDFTLVVTSYWWWTASV